MLSRENDLSYIKQSVRAGILFAPAAFLATPTKTLLDVCNGCGAANAKFDFIPDKIYGTYIGDCCDIHDFMYSEGRTFEDKQEADRVFLNNLNRIINRACKQKWYKPKLLMRRRAIKYYRAVDLFGGDAYWAGKN
jgi:hypothetical protein